LDIILILLIAVGAKFEVSADVVKVMIAASIITLTALVLGVVDDARDVSVAGGAATGTISDQRLA